MKKLGKTCPVQEIPVRQAPVLPVEEGQMQNHRFTGAAVVKCPYTRSTAVFAAVGEEDFLPIFARYSRRRDF